MEEKQIVEQMLKRVGQSIANINEFTESKLNELITKSDEWKALGYEEDDWNHFATDETIQMLEDDGEFIVTLEDKTKIKRLRFDYKCILHSTVVVEGTEVYRVGGGNLFICADCNTMLKANADIVDKFDTFRNDDTLLFPADWNDNGVRAWCKKRQDKDAIRSERYSQRREAIFNMKQQDHCPHCPHWSELSEFCEKYMDDTECYIFN